MGQPLKHRIPKDPVRFDAEAGVLPYEHGIPSDPLEPFTDVIARERATLGMTDPVRGDVEAFHAAAKCVMARVARPLAPTEKARLRL